MHGGADALVQIHNECFYSVTRQYKLRHAAFYNHTTVGPPLT